MFPTREGPSGRQECSGAVFLIEVPVGGGGVPVGWVVTRSHGVEQAAAVAEPPLKVLALQAGTAPRLALLNRVVQLESVHVVTVDAAGGVVQVGLWVPCVARYSQWRHTVQVSHTWGGGEGYR